MIQKVRQRTVLSVELTRETEQAGRKDQRLQAETSLAGLKNKGMVDRRQCHYLKWKRATGRDPSPLDWAEMGFDSKCNGMHQEGVT